MGTDPYGQLVVELDALQDNSLHGRVVLGPNQAEFLTPIPASTPPSMYNLALAAARDIGTGLFRAIFQGETLSLYRTALSTAMTENRAMPIAVHNSFSQDRFPWELLYDPHLQRFLTLSRHTPLIRIRDSVLTESRPLITKKPRILVIMSSPDGLTPTLNLLQEKKWLRYILDPLEHSGLAEVVYFENPVFEELQAFLAANEVHLVHFMGHAAFDDEAQEGVLWLEDMEGRERPLRATVLEGILSRTQVRLIVLNACQTSVGGPLPGALSVTQACARAEIPYVIAMQARITDRAAIAFAKVLYRNLLSGLPVLDSVTAARQSIQSSEEHFTGEWATPVLMTSISSPEASLISSSAHHPFQVVSTATTPEWDFAREIDTIRRAGMLSRLETHFRTLLLLEEQRARCGQNIPITTAREIELHTGQFAELQAQLGLYDLPEAWLKRQRESQERQLATRVKSLEVLRQIEIEGIQDVNARLQLRGEITTHEQEIAWLERRLGMVSNP